MFNNDVWDKNSVILLFLVVYFGFQIFSQMWGTYFSEGVPSTQNYVQNFVFALVLIGLVIYFGNPKIPFNKATLSVVVVMFVFNFLYCYSKKAIDNQSKKDDDNNVNSQKKALVIILSSIFGLLVAIYIYLYMTSVEMGQRTNVLIYFAILVVLLTSFYYFKNSNQYENKFSLPLLLYPLLFLTSNVGTYWGVTLIYVTMFTTVVAMWGFFGVEWFVGPKKEYMGGINREMCKAYLGISDSDLTSTGNPQTQTAINTKNINFIYIAVSLIFVAFLVAVVFAYVSIKKILNNT